MQNGSPVWNTLVVPQKVKWKIYYDYLHQRIETGTQIHGF